MTALMLNDLRPEILPKALRNPAHREVGLGLYTVDYASL